MSGAPILRLMVLAGCSAAVALLLSRDERPWACRADPGALRWPAVERCRLEVDLTVPGRFAAVAELELAGPAGARVDLLLNRDLEVEAATADGVPVDVDHGGRLPGVYRQEGRVVTLALPAAARGARRLRLEYAGPAASGREGNDWRGILFVDADEARMSEQTIFYPQVPNGLDGPEPVGQRFDLVVRAPGDWEVFAPLPPLDVEAAGAGSRRWSFRGERAQALSILGGLRVRSEARRGGLMIVTLLRPGHVAQAPAFEREAVAVLDDFSARFGALDAGVLGIIEITCRDDSYNWASDGVIAIDTRILGGDVPRDTLSHEVAHLWWGQAAGAAGPGERFLTEGLAEHSSWTWLERHDGSLAFSLEIAQRRVTELVEAGESEALADVSFGHPEYQTLAYAKGPLVLRALEGQLAPGALDRALARLVARGAAGPLALDDFEACLREETGLSGLQPCWFRQGGDLDLALEDVDLAPGGGTLVIRATPAGPQPVDAAGTPVALDFGGPGWREQLTVLLTGPATRVDLDPSGRPLSFVVLDPAGCWTRDVATRAVVAAGADLVASEPGLGGVVRHGGTRVVLEYDLPLAPVDAAVLRESAAAGDEWPLTVLGARLDAEGRRLVVETAPWRPDLAYRLDLRALTDATGVPLVADRFRFRTAVSDDVTPPRVVALDPPSGARLPPGAHTLAITFDEPMLPGRAFKTWDVDELEARGERFPALGDRGEWSTDGRTLTYRLELTEPGATYTLPLRPEGFRDLSNIGCESVDWSVTMAEPEG